MDSYKCNVRLSGEIGQEVPKEKISAAHIAMLQIEHGDDAVIDVEKISDTLKWPGDHGKPITVTQPMMRSFLEREFGEEKVGKVFGSFYGAQLPEVLRGFEKTRAIPAAKKNVQTSKPSAKIIDEDFEDDIDTDIDTDLDDNEKVAL